MAKIWHFEAKKGDSEAKQPNQQQVFRSVGNLLLDHFVEVARGTERRGLTGKVKRLYLHEASGAILAQVKFSAEKPGRFISRVNRQARVELGQQYASQWLDVKVLKPFGKVPPDLASCLAAA